MNDEVKHIVSEEVFDHQLLEIVKTAQAGMIIAVVDGAIELAQFGTDPEAAFDCDAGLRLGVIFAMANRIAESGAIGSESWTPTNGGESDA